eukprot:gene17144-biopygen12856
MFWESSQGLHLVGTGRGGLYGHIVTRPKRVPGTRSKRVKKR